MAAKKASDAIAALSPVSIKKYQRPKCGFKEAAVMAILFPKNEEWHLLFIERTSKYPQDKHAGQISFPGGQLEPNETIQECAYREVKEEIGIGKDQLHWIGALTELYIDVSNFLVYPFIAYANGPLVFKQSDDEVQSILEIPLSHLMDPKNLKRKDITVRNRTLINVPYYDLNGHTLWGATSMMTAELLEIIKEKE